MEKIGERYPLFIGMARCTRHDSQRSILSDGCSIMKRCLFLTLAVAGMFSWVGLAITPDDDPSRNSSPILVRDRRARYTAREATTVASWA